MLTAPTCSTAHRKDDRMNTRVLQGEETRQRALPIHAPGGAPGVLHDPVGHPVLLPVADSQDSMIHFVWCVVTLGAVDGKKQRILSRVLDNVLLVTLRLLEALKRGQKAKWRVIPCPISWTFFTLAPVAGVIPDSTGESTCPRRCKTVVELPTATLSNTPTVGACQCQQVRTASSKHPRCSLGAAEQELLSERQWLKGNSREGSRKNSRGS